VGLLLDQQVVNLSVLLLTQRLHVLLLEERTRVGAAL